MNPIFLKEIREMMRDRRVVVGAFVMPILTMVLMTKLFSFIGESLTNKDVARIYVVAGDSSQSLLKPVKSDDRFKIDTVPTEAEGRALLKKGKAKLVLIPDPASTPDHTQIRALYDSGETISAVVLGRFKEAVQKQNALYLQSFLKERDLPERAAEPIKIQDEDTAINKQGESPLTSLIPYLLILFMFSGGMSIAADLVAGEKERGTLETLLITPMERSKIILGKFLALMLFCVLSATTSLAGLLISGMIDPMAKKMLFSNGLTVTPLQVVEVLLVLISLATFFAGVQLAISIWAKNMREAQTYLGLANFFVIIPSVFSNIIGMTDAGHQSWVRFTPILNSALAIRDMLLGTLTPIGFIAPLITSAILAGLALTVAVRMFTRETVLARA